MKYNKKASILPGFRFTLAYTITYLTIIVLTPLSLIFWKIWNLGFSHLLEIMSSARILSSIKLTFSCSFIAAFINSLIGLLIAWVLVRYKFYGKKLMEVVIDIPFALPTAIAGIALATIYAPDGILGKLLLKLNIKVAYTPIGIIIAMMFVGLPFAVRTIEPVLQDITKDTEEAAATLGASKFVIFYKIIFPYIMPSFLTGFALSFARGLGEYGSIIFISGNIPYFSEVISLVMITKLEQYDYDEALAIAAIMLIFSFVILLLINILQKNITHNK
jgi:sulfate transport system permease protein